MPTALEVLKKQKANLEAEYAELKAAMLAYESQILPKPKEKAANRNEMHSKKTQAETLTKEKQRLLAELDQSIKLKETAETESKKKIEQLARELENLEGRNGALAKQKACHTTGQSTQKTEKQTSQKQVSSLAEEVRKLEEEQETLMAQTKQLEQRLEEAQKLLASKKAELASLLEKNKKQSDIAEKRRSHWVEENTALYTGCTDRRLIVAGLKEELAKIKLRQGLENADLRRDLEGYQIIEKAMRALKKPPPQIVQPAPVLLPSMPIPTSACMLVPPPPSSATRAPSDNLAEHRRYLLVSEQKNRKP